MNTSDNIVKVDFNKVFQEDKVIDISSIKRTNRKLSSSVISFTEDDSTRDLAVDHTSEPIKNIDDIIKISEYLIERKRYRDNMLFIVGINFGLRVSDLRTLKFSDIIDSDLTFKESFPIFEIKTRNTRRHKRNRYLTINDAVVEAVTLYLENTSGVKLSDYMFRSESHHGMDMNEPIHRNSIDRIIKNVVDECGVNIKASTHTLRKTFAYHQMLTSNNDPRKLLLLQKILGHSSVAQTLDYIGITEEEISSAYKELNLGLHNHFLDSNVVEYAM